ncbi:hypothetical protein [Actinosynnema sp. NPDC023587]
MTPAARWRTLAAIDMKEQKVKPALVARRPSTTSAGILGTRCLKVSRTA